MQIPPAAKKENRMSNTNEYTFKTISRVLDETRSYYIRLVIKACGGNKQEAAKVLDVSEATLYRYLKEYPNYPKANHIAPEILEAALSNTDVKLEIPNTPEGARELLLKRLADRDKDIPDGYRRIDRMEIDTNKDFFHQKTLEKVTISDVDFSAERLRYQKLNFGITTRIGIKEFIETYCTLET